MAALEIRGLALARPGFSLDFDLALPDGAFGVILGPSGCGKSTALRLIAGLSPADGGSIRLGGRELSGLPTERRGVGLVFQDLALFGHMSAKRNMEYGPRLARVPAAERHEATLELARAFGIEGLLDRYPAELSGGERQRVALARSLAAKPSLLLLDEPLSALDAALRRELRSEIRERVKAAGIPALHVTHDIEEALALADRLYLMRDGRVVESGAPEEVFDHPQSAFAARLLGRGPVLAVRGLAIGDGTASGGTAFGDFACKAPPDNESCVTSNYYRSCDTYNYDQSCDTDNYEHQGGEGRLGAEPASQDRPTAPAAGGRDAAEASDDRPEQDSAASGWSLHFAAAAGEARPAAPSAQGGAGRDEEPRPDSVAFRALLVRASYAGDSWRLELRAPGGESMEVAVPSLSGLEPGKELVLSVPRAALSLVQSSSSPDKGEAARAGTAKP